MREVTARQILVSDDEPTRRRLLALATASAAGLAAAGCAADAAEPPSPPQARQAGDPAAVPTPVSPHGATQAGVDRPATAQSNLSLTVFGLAPTTRPGPLLRALGERISALTAGHAPALAALNPGDLTMTVGVGPRLVAAVDPALPGAVDLPGFAREQITPQNRGGDLMVQVCAGDGLVTALAAGDLAACAHEHGATVRWSQNGFRRYNADRIAINLLGFHDGIVSPSATDLPKELWLDAPAPVAGGTIAVVRRLRIDVGGFLGQPLDHQEAAIGRRRGDGAPLSGGTIDSPLRLGAKTADGRYLIPAAAHARRADPLPAGVGVILRRGYTYDNGPADQGLLFIAFHRELRTFVQTQLRLDEQDALMEYTIATASASFLILPGYQPETALGSALF